MKKTKDNKKNKKQQKKLNPCNENKYIDRHQIRQGLGLTENAKILMEN